VVEHIRKPLPELQIAPNVTIETLSLLLRIQEGPNSNLCPENGYHDRFFEIFLSPSRQMLEYLEPRSLLSVSFPIHYSLIIVSFDVIL
jgi:hypothetical protein